jgi:LysR family transcriptional regulator, benzoate and cis,cis-muconate-responsive activator of ben and cat genes
LVKNGLGISIFQTNVVKNYNDPELDFVELKKGNIFTDILLATPKNQQSEISKVAVDFLKTTS